MVDLLNLISLIGAVQGIFFGLVLLRLHQGNRIANRWLAVFLLVFSITMIGVVAYTSRWILKAPHLALLHTPFAAINASPFFLYILAMTQKDFKMKAWHALLFVPFLIVVFWQIPFYRLSAAEKYAVLVASYSGFPDSWKYSFIFSTATTLVLLIATYVAVLRHERVVREVYSNLTGKSMAWTRNFLFAGTATFVLCVLVSFVDVSLADPVSNLLFSITIYVFGYRALRQPEIFSDVDTGTLPGQEQLALIHRSGKYEKSGLGEEKAKQLLARLERLMLEEKIYLDPMLNLQQLAERLALPAHQVSQLLNQFCGESFSDYVNRFRVDAVKQAIADPALAHLSLLAIAFECGFNSKAAFNAVFKKMTGMTPSGYKDNLAVAPRI